MTYAAYFVLEGRGTAAPMQAVPASRQNRGFQRGFPFGTRLCNAKCSVLYLLSRLAGKMRVSPDGNAHFARQENGQVFADRGEQKAGRFREWQQVYKTHQ